jgi:hypothetical protein
MKRCQIVSMRALISTKKTPDISALLAGKSHGVNPFSVNLWVKIFRNASRLDQ